MSEPELEQLLLQQLAEAESDPTYALSELARFYKVTGQHSKALARLQQLLERASDPEDKTECVFNMGQVMEDAGDYAAAVDYYRKALDMEPAATSLRYFVYNNLGFSLNVLGRFIEGEEYCRKAIGVDPNRANGHKNLGLALKGQGCFREAAQAFIDATAANPGDPRAFKHLLELLRQQPDLEPEFTDALSRCRQAIETALDQARTARKAAPAILPPGEC